MKDARDHYKNIGKRTDGLVEKNMQAHGLGDGALKEVKSCKYLLHPLIHNVSYIYRLQGSFYGP